MKHLYLAAVHQARPDHQHQRCDPTATVVRAQPVHPARPAPDAAVAHGDLLIEFWHSLDLHHLSLRRDHAIAGRVERGRYGVR